MRTESIARDGGLRARLERAAATVAILRGLGYAGAYIGGTHDADAIAWIIRRAEALAPRWQELAAGLSYGRAGGFYLYDAGTRPRQIEPARKSSGRSRSGTGPRSARTSSW